MEDPLDDLLVQTDLDHDAVGVGEDFVALLVQQVDQRAHVGPLGDGCHNVTAVVKDRQPGAHAVADRKNVVGVDLVAPQLADDFLADAVLVHQTDVGGPQLHVGNVLRHVAAHAAVNLLDPTDVPTLGNILVHGEPLRVHEHRADDYNTHARKPPVIYICFIVSSFPEKFNRKCFFFRRNVV